MQAHPYRHRPSRSATRRVWPGILILLLLAPAAAPAQTPLPLGTPLPRIQLKDFQGQPFDSSELAPGRPTVVVWIGTECPLVKLYSRRLADARKQYGDQVHWIAINANQQDSLQDLAKFARDHEFDLPLLKDPGNRIADAMGARRTPEVFLFDQQQRLCYRGAIDDQYSYGKQKDQADQSYLRDALAALLDQRAPEVAETEPVGCLIGRRLEPDPQSSITYSNQISRLLNRHCVECHREGEVAPFALTDYEEVVGWAEMIAEVTGNRRMPPWHANPAHGTFANDISLSEQEIERIAAWVRAGAPEGDRSELPPPPVFEKGWRIGKPDVVVAMAEEPCEVPATGVIPYRYFTVDPGFTEDKWIQAAECRIGNPAVVHHIIVGIEGEPNRPPHGQIRSEWITATAPGAPPLRLPEGYAKLIPAGSKLVFQMHYTPNGTPQTDLSKVGFKFADPESVRRSVGTREIINRDFVRKRFAIPAGQDNFPIAASIEFPQDALILSLFPHMHLRGKSFRYTATYPAGHPGPRTEVLLDIPHYDFNWQNVYRLPEPKLLPAGTRIDCQAHYDNSADNFANPHPEQDVYWGDQTEDEMMIGYFDMALADQDLRADGQRPRTRRAEAQLAGRTDLPESLVQRASRALLQPQGFPRLGLEVVKVLPQIDRLCLTQVKDGQLSVVRLVQHPSFTEVLGNGEVTTDAGPTLLAKLANGDQPRVLPDLTASEGSDIEYMRRAARSSFHVPVTYQGQPATINFWSAEPDAFPEGLQGHLVALARQIMER